MNVYHMLMIFFFFKLKKEYEMRISDWGSDVCSSDLAGLLAIGVNDAGQRIGIEQLGTDRIVCRGESLIVAFGDRHAGSHGMSAIALQQSRMARIEQYQRIAQMQPRNRTTRAFQQAAFLRARERAGRPMQLVLDLGRDPADRK